MTDRLRARDVAFLSTESAATPMHNATVEIFDPPDADFGHAQIMDLIADRIAFVPRYRQRLESVPLGLARPVWVDDPDFDLAFHVRRSALPRPGTMDQLRELVERIVARPLDRHRPLWEVYVIEGLADGRVAVLSKSHQILVDGVQTVDLGQVLLDVGPEPKELEQDDWEPEPSSSAGRLLDAARDVGSHPIAAVETLRDNALAVSCRLPLGGLLAQVTQRPAAESPINAELSEQRRVVMLRTDLADYRAVRRAHGGSVNDVVLATITGALRSWLMSRSESLGNRRWLRAMVPMSVIDDELEPTSLGTQIAGHLVKLPIGETSPVVRLHQVSYAFTAHRETGRAVAANRLAGIAGFAPTTFHALGSRVAFEHQRRGSHLTITNVPGPQFPLYAAGARMTETYPVLPLMPGQALAIGVTSYDGHVFFGITADRDALPDVDLLGVCITESLEELVESSSSSRPRAPRGRAGTTSPRRKK